MGGGTADHGGRGDSRRPGRGKSGLARAVQLPQARGEGHPGKSPWPVRDKASCPAGCLRSVGRRWLVGGWHGLVVGWEAWRLLLSSMRCGGGGSGVWDVAAARWAELVEGWAVGVGGRPGCCCLSACRLGCESGPAGRLCGVLAARLALAGFLFLVHREGRLGRGRAGGRHAATSVPPCKPRLHVAAAVGRQGGWPRAGWHAVRYARAAVPCSIRAHAAPNAAWCLVANRSPAAAG